MHNTDTSQRMSVFEKRRLNKVDKDLMIQLLTHPLVQRHMPLSSVIMGVIIALSISGANSFESSINPAIAVMLFVTLWA